MFPPGQKYVREKDPVDAEGQGWGPSWVAPSKRRLRAMSFLSCLAIMIAAVAIGLGGAAMRVARDAERRLDGVEGIVASATVEVVEMAPASGTGLSNQGVSNDTASMSANVTEGEVEEASPSGTEPGPDFKGTIADGEGDDVNNFVPFDAQMGVVVHGRDDDPFWYTVQQGMKDAAELFGVHFFYDNPADSEEETYLEQMERDIRRARYGLFSGLAVSIPDGERLRDAIELAAEEMPVVSINAGHRDFADLGVLTHIGIPEFESGQQAGEIMKKRGVQSAICVMHEDSAPLRERCAGLEEALEGDVTNITLTQEQSAADAQSAIEDALTANGDIKGVLTLGQVGFGPALEALRGKICTPGTSPDTADCLAFGTFDATPEALAAIVDGDLDFTMDQQEYLQGYLSIAFLYMKSMYGVSVGGGAPVMSGPVLVDSADSAQTLLRRNFTSGMTLTNETARKLDIRYVVHGKPKDTFWKFVKFGVKIASRMRGTRIDYREPSISMDDNEVRQFMVDAIDEAVEEGVDGLVVTVPNDSATLRKAIKAAADAGIPVISISGGDDLIREEDYGIVLHVGQGQETAGRGVGRRLADAGVTKALCYMHDASDVTLKERCDGLEDGMKSVNPDAEVDKFPAPSNLTTRQMSTSILDLLESDAAIDAVVALGEPAYFPAVDAVEELDKHCVGGRAPGREGEESCIAVVTYSFDFPVLNYIEEGKVLFGVDEGPFVQGYLSLAFLTLQNLWNNMPVGIVNTGPSFIDTTNVGLYEFFV